MKYFVVLLNHQHLRLARLYPLDHQGVFEMTWVIHVAAITGERKPSVFNWSEIMMYFVRLTGSEGSIQLGRLYPYWGEYYFSQCEHYGTLGYILVRSHLSVVPSETTGEG